MIDVRRSAATASGWLLHRLARASRRVFGHSEGGSDRVAMLCESFVRYGTGQAVGLAAIGVDVTFYYVAGRLDQFGGSLEDRQRFLDELAKSGVDVVEIPHRRLSRLVPDVVWLHRDLSRRRIQTVLVQAHIDPRYATVGLRFPSAVMVHDPRPHTGDFESAFPLPVRALSRVSELTASCVVVHSRGLKGQLYPMFGRVPVAIIPHGAQVIGEAPAPLSEPPRIVLVGRLLRYKGVDTALQAFKLLRERRNDATLVLAGRGDLAAEIQREAVPGVELRDGYLTEEEMVETYEGARLIVLPYRDGTQSGVGLQAVARGIPCIVSDVGALPDLVPAGMPGAVVPPGDPAALATAIERYLDHTVALRQEVFALAQNEFAWPAVGRRLLSELQRLGVVTGVEQA